MGANEAHVLPRQPSRNPLILGGWGAPGKFPGAAFVMLREESRLSSSYLCSLGEG